MIDYVIIGAGTAGCVLAGRLSEDRKVNVLLLEAGGPAKGLDTRMPIAFSRQFQGPTDWNLETTPQRHLDNRQLYWPRGKVVGGSGAMNAMIHIRGNKLDFNHWRDLGCTGWGYADVLPYFKKCESVRGSAPEYHGKGGPLPIGPPRYRHRLSRAFIEATYELGFPQNDDFNGAHQDGYGYYPVTLRRGARCNTAAAYLRKRRNLTIITNTQTQRILLDGSRATGVQFTHNGRTEMVSVNREIILCAGAVHSPQLLMLSGVGPSGHLEDVGIEPVAHVPGVGRNLQDHLMVPVAFRLAKPKSIKTAESFLRMPFHLLRYGVFGRGPLTSNIAEAGGFVRIDRDAAAPDLQFHFAPCFYLRHGFEQPKGHGFSIGPTLLQPKSTGRIKLRSKHVGDAPLIDPNYGAHKQDIHLLVEGIRLARRIASATAFDFIRDSEHLPGIASASDETLAAFVRERAETLYHPVGTCKMGTDSLSVVDPQLRVHGMEGLRVADASIMPAITRGNTNAPTVMIAEKAADLIKND